MTKGFGGIARRNTGTRSAAAALVLCVFCSVFSPGPAARQKKKNGGIVDNASAAGLPDDPQLRIRSD